MKNPFHKTRELKKVIIRQPSPEQPSKFIADVVEWKFFNWTWWSNQVLLWRAHDGDWIGKHIQLPE